MRKLDDMILYPLLRKSQVFSGLFRRPCWILQQCNGYQPRRIAQVDRKRPYFFTSFFTSRTRFFTSFFSSFLRCVSLGALISLVFRGFSPLLGVWRDWRDSGAIRFQLVPRLPSFANKDEHALTRQFAKFPA